MTDPALPDLSAPLGSFPWDGRHRVPLVGRVHDGSSAARSLSAARIIPLGWAAPSSVVHLGASHQEDGSRPNTLPPHIA
jgi:hypothetical protein